MNELISLIIAIIGCITGIISLTIVVINNFFQIGKQNFHLSERRKSYYFKAKDTKTKGCCDVNICASVSIKATNKSAFPITIDEAILKKGNEVAYHFNDFEFKYIEIEKSADLTVYCDSEELATLPFKLDPFETKFFSFVFPFFDDLVSSYGEIVKPNLLIITPRKKYTVPITINEYYNCVLYSSNKSKSKDVASLSANK